jgi:formate dehydrogenase subunit delta
MEGPKLAKMANAIAQFFEADEDRETMLAGIAGHLERFWDPRMRRALLDWIDNHGGEGLRDSVLAAVAARRAIWEEAIRRHQAR